MPVPDLVLRLVDTFAVHLDHYKSSGYNEAQLRREFLDPLFKALGWDIDNEAGYADAYKDVIHEDTIKIGGVTKAPDYCFRIGGTRKFFVESKKPSVDVKSDIHPAYQLRRYAWSAKLPLSVLSDFEEFSVYDTRVKPTPSDRASTARTFYCTFKQYQEKWDEIAAIFSREAILRGAFDKYAEGSKKKRGTAEVDDAFLEEIERWRELLAKNFALRNPRLTVRDLNFAVQKTIDRLIFLRICEDRGTEDYGRLQALRNGSNSYERLCQLFLQADDRYDSGLFHFRHEKNEHGEPDLLTLDLKLDDKPLKDIFRSLYYPDSPYEFSVLPADILGQVYERFLGKTISLNAGHQARIEEKPEVRKAGGVYYTPTYIVEYIVDNTLGRLLNGPNPDKPKPISVSQAADIKVLDPACGSGSFLIVAYQRLLDWHLARYIEKADHHSRGKNPNIYQSRGGDYRLTTAERKRILLNNIHGVDIDRQAVEVTKLSLLLKVLEGETEQIVQRNWLKERERILPDLGANIQCGNSLIGPDFYEKGQLLLLDEDQQYRINVFDWEAAFPEIMKRGGFDCVIGNPPYGATLDHAQKAYLGSRYICQSYQLDSYLLFLECVLSSLQRVNGKGGFIIPNPWLTNLKQDATRRFICSAASIEQIVHFKFPVFRSAVVDTEIVILGIPADARNQVKIFSCSNLLPNGSLNLCTVAIHSQNEWMALDGGVINIFLGAKEKALFSKIQKYSQPLERWFQINVGIKPYQKGKGMPPQTDNHVRERPFDATSKLDATYRELLRGSDINRYTISPQPRFISYGPWLAEPRPAAGFDAPEKLLMRQTGDRPIAALDTSRRLAMNNMHVLAPRDGMSELNIRYFLGILNSKLLTWFYRCLNPEAGEALAEVKRANVAALPIYPIDVSSPADMRRHDKMVTLVGRILELHQKLAGEKNPESREHLQALIDTTDRQIDRFIYELYTLTSEEMEVVEKSFPADSPRRPE